MLVGDKLPDRSNYGQIICAANEEYSFSCYVYKAALYRLITRKMKRFLGRRPTKNRCLKIFLFARDRAKYPRKLVEKKKKRRRRKKIENQDKNSNKSRDSVPEFVARWTRVYDIFCGDSFCTFYFLGSTKAFAFRQGNVFT